MRLDQDHVDKLAHAIDGDGDVKLDIAFMRSAFPRLSMWERGLLIEAITRAISSKKLSREQRVLLALFVHQSREGDHE